MATDRRSQSFAILNVLCVLATLLVGYALGYSAMVERVHVGPPRVVTRHYGSFWIAAIFRPAARIDGWLTSREVETAV